MVSGLPLISLFFYYIFHYTPNIIVVSRDVKLFQGAVPVGLELQHRVQETIVDTLAQHINDRSSFS